MFLVGIFSWWYGDGLKGRLHMTRDRLAISADFFSVKLLLSTLFAPYRQISAGGVQGSINVQLRAFLDQLLSRFIGAFVRIFMIIAGLITMLVQIIFGIILILSWIILPVVPIIGLIMMAVGWVPQWLI